MIEPWGWLDLNQRILKESDLQSDAIDRYATPPEKRMLEKGIEPSTVRLQIECSAN